MTYLVLFTNVQECTNFNVMIVVALHSNYPERIVHQVKLKEKWHFYDCFQLKTPLITKEIFRAYVNVVIFGCVEYLDTVYILTYQ